MISCNDCRQRLGEILDESGIGSASAEVQGHLAGCEKCRADLALLTAARDEMRAFPSLVAPADLRERIRREVEAAAKEAAAKNDVTEAIAPQTDSLKNDVVGSAFATTTVAPVGDAASEISPNDGATPSLFAEPLRHPNVAESFPKPERTFPAPAAKINEIRPAPLSERRGNFASFLRNPTNVTWMSCAVILLFYFASLSLPRSTDSPVAEAPAPNVAKQEKVTEPQKKETATDSAPSGKASPATRDNTPNPSAAPGPTPAVPPKIPPLPPGLEAADKAQPPVSTPATTTKPYPQRPDADVLEGIEFTNPSTPAITRAPRPAPAPSPAPRVAQTRPAPRSPQSPTAAPAMKQRAPENNSQRFAGRSTPGGAAQAYRPSGPAAFSAPAPRMESESQFRDADRAMLRSNSAQPQKRSISTRISSPRNLGWAQVSVNLPEGVRFSDGSKARIIWRGTAQANEPIELDFDVLTSSPGQELRITLQEVKNQDAQTVAHKSVPID